MGILAGKKALIVGVASNRSIAWSIAEFMHQQGAELAFTYLDDKLAKRVNKIAEQTNSNIVLPCDVASDEQIKAVFDELEKQWGCLDIIVHAVGFAPRELLQGHYLENLSREGYQTAMDISSYSFAALAKAGHYLMKDRDAALLTLTYLGALRAMDNYNVMGVAKAALEANVRYIAKSMGPDGIRVNGISAGPIKTLAASGIGNFKKMLHHVERAAPLKRTVDQMDVAKAATFLCSDWASGITGEITYVDAGYNIMAMADIE
ncbi:enoyl-ACP reductase FabI [Marinicella gelatinilytica]|uniref:enoyl-ACP reductase FabI n=1 Tax=Marinicella gelatinilytica TaxID=2996017 RepID=UPI0022608A58|nr:enoyl-ACP reductase [Marinicella gelatinilytica]MCX7543853.1 enoyl-ACP reductase [Marinicella gelatinilytica]